MSAIRLTLVGADGHLYSASLPSRDGENSVYFTGADLKIKTPKQIEAIILSGRLRLPPKGSTSRWEVEKFDVNASRPPEVQLTYPHLVSSPEGTNVAQECLRIGQPLRMTLMEAQPTAHVDLLDPAGKHASLPQDSFSGRHLVISFDATPGLWQADVTQGRKRTHFRFLVLGALPRHPRLFLSQTRLDELKSSPVFAGLRQQIHARAKKLASGLAYNAEVGEEIDLMPSGRGIEPAFPGQMKPYVDVTMNYADAIFYNALDYRLNDNRDSLASARRALLVVSKWKAWVPPRWRSHGLKTYYQVGVFTERVAFGYDLIADDLMPQEKAQIANALWEKSIEPTVEECFLYNRDPIAASNHEAHSVGGAIAAIVASAGEWPGWNGRESTALAELTAAFEQLLKGLFPGDGSEAEPAGYENFAMQGLSWGTSALAAMEIHPAGTQRMFNGFWWAYYAAAWPRHVLDTGDFNGHLQTVSGFAWSAEHAGIPELRAFYDAETKFDSAKLASPAEGTRVMEQIRPLDLACCSTAPAAPAMPPPSRVFSGRGGAVLRSGWHPSSTVISVRVGPWFNHEHHDEGSFQAAAFGQDLIGEAGQASYYTDPRYDDYFSQAAGHNAVLVDQNPFSQAAFAGRYQPGLTYPHFTSQLLGNSFDYLSADLTSAYDGRLVSYQRDFFFLKPDILIVWDRLRAAQAHTFAWLLHVPPGAETQIADAKASIQQPNASALLTAAGTNTDWKQAETPIPINAFTDLDHKKIQRRWEFVLNSPRTTSAQFLVGMKFVKGTHRDEMALKSWKQAAGEGLRDGATGSSIVCRTGTGMLQIGALSTDGTVLALRGPRNWLAIAARRVQQGDRILLAATTRVDVEAATRGENLQVHLHNSGGELALSLAFFHPHNVRMDGHTHTFVYRGGMVIISDVPGGEHLVEIQ